MDAMNPYEQAARERKVAKLLDALDAEMGRPVTEADMDNPPADLGLRAWARAGVNKCSDETFSRLAERIRERDKIAGSRA